MGKIIDITLLLRAINENMSKRNATWSTSSGLTCEECQTFAKRLHLTKEGFFHCYDCLVKIRAVQEFDSD